MAATRCFTLQRLAEETAAGLSLTITGAYPLSPLLPGTMKEPEVTALLTPLLLAAASAQRAHAAVAPVQETDSRKREREFYQLRNEDKRLKNSLSKNSSSGKDGSSGSKGGGGGRGPRGKGKGGASGQSMPAELIGLNPNYKGKRLCYAFNMQAGCDKVLRNNECSSGHHLCMRCGGKPSTALAALPWAVKVTA